MAAMPRRRDDEADADGSDLPPGALDVGRILQIASNGFIYLIIAEGIGLLLGGGLLIPLVTAAVYVYLGRKAARGRHRPFAHGAWAAGCSYSLLVPLRVFIAANSDDPIFTPSWSELAFESVISLALAVVIGGMAGRIEGGVSGEPGDNAPERG